MDRATAETYASWFRCVADPTRLQILRLLSIEGRPLRVGEIADAVGLSQSTVSVHLRRLLDDEFVEVERVATASWFTINRACVAEFPRAAAAVMGGVADASAPLPPPTPPWAQHAGVQG